MDRPWVWLLLGALVLSGALGAPYLADEVAFESIERAHFTAIAVARETGPAQEAPLVVRVSLVGDATDADLEEAFAWLRTNANVIVEQHPDGAPLFLTRLDLAATSGRATLGATVREGMAVEWQDPELGSCVVAHEVLHFLGLRHVDDPRNIMYPHCNRAQLGRAILEDWQVERLASIERIDATTPGGLEVWAER